EVQKLGCPCARMPGASRPLVDHRPYRLPNASDTARSIEHDAIFFDRIGESLGIPFARCESHPAGEQATERRHLRAVEYHRRKARRQVSREFGIRGMPLP